MRFYNRRISLSALTLLALAACGGSSNLYQGMDADALPFKLARRILADGVFTAFVADRYASYDSGFGREIETGKASLASLEKLVLTKLGEPTPRSGRQEYLENLLMSYLHG